MSNLHTVLDGDQYADICVIRCSDGYLKARVAKNKLVNHLLSLIEIDEDTSWVTGIFKDGSTCLLQPYAWRETHQEALNAEYERKVWVSLSKVGITSGYDPNALYAALEAQRKLKEANQEYRETLVALGATQKEEGSYEDYQLWLELPGAPMLRF